MVGANDVVQNVVRENIGDDLVVLIDIGTQGQKTNVIERMLM